MGSEKEKSTKPKGLGDTIEMFTKLTGLKQVVETVTNGDCGCKKRKDKLNKLFPYKEKNNERK